MIFLLFKKNFLSSIRKKICLSLVFKTFQIKKMKYTENRLQPNVRFEKRLNAHQFYLLDFQLRKFRFFFLNMN